MQIAVFGASGFVGSTLVERMLSRQTDELRIVLHGTGNAWQLSRHNINFYFADIMSRSQIKDVLKGCTHVVNCTRGPNNVMLRGLNNLLQECLSLGIERFVHLSSVAVYGDPPPPNSCIEDATPKPNVGTYGWIKFQQDKIVGQAHSKGLDCVVLCPPNISGRRSPFVQGVISDINRGSIVLKDDGSSVINLVDVDNLCHAIELALTCPSTDGRRIFITDNEKINWRTFVDSLKGLHLVNEYLPSLMSDEFEAKFKIDTFKPNKSILRSIKRMISSDVREALRKDPLLEAIDSSIRSLIAKLPEEVEERIIYAVEGPIKITKVGGVNSYTSQYNPQQLRNVYHHSDRAMRFLKYEPEYTFSQSSLRFKKWYGYARGIENSTWDLAQYLISVDQ